MKLDNLLEQTDKVLSQDELKGKLKGITKQDFRKKSIVALVNASELDKELLGKIDKTSYTDDYKKENIKAIVQSKKDGTIDAYIPPKDTLNSYEEVKPDNEILIILDKISIDKNKVKFLKKKDVTKMIKASELDLENKTIRAPWGGIQYAETGSYIVDGGHEAYIVNPDSNGNPIGYERV